MGRLGQRERRELSELAVQSDAGHGEDALTGLQVGQTGGHAGQVAVTQRLLSRDAALRNQLTAQRHLV